jgi:uncharacterized OB-fold protein
VAAKKVLPNYELYLKWRGLYQPDPGARRSPMPIPSATALFRERERNLRFHVARCLACGTVQYPPQRVCTKCGKRDDFEPVRLADRPARLFTYALEYIAGSVDVPLAVGVVNFARGGRALMTMTDRVVEEIDIDVPLEMSFRKLFTRPEIARKIRDDYVLVKRIGLAASGRQGLLQDDYDFVHFEESVRAAKMAYEQAGITQPLQEIDLAEVHDCFTITELLI